MACALKASLDRALGGDADDSPAFRRLTWALVGLTTLPLLASVFNRVHGDIYVYARAAGALFSGAGLYAEVPFEYPPYALALVVVPGALQRLVDPGGLDVFHVAFPLQMLALDAAIKVVLLREGRRLARGVAALLPFLLFTAAGVLQEYVYLKRFDLAPAGLTLLAAIALARGRFLGAGAALGAGAGVKLYPLLLVPLALALAVRQRRWGPFVAGLAASLAPAALLAAHLPWWRFGSFHAGRGLQVESIWAALLWLARPLGIAVEWRCLPSWDELGGPHAAALLPWAQGVWLGAVALSVALSASAAWRAGRADVARVAAWMTLPILAFAAFHFVLSPQYHLWFMTLAALLALGPRRGEALALLAATALVPLWFPGRTYHTGLEGWRTAALLVRDLVLLAVWARLAIAAAARLGPPPRVEAARPR